MKVEIVGVRAFDDIESRGFGIRIGWSDEDIGYGSIDITQETFENGETEISMDTELMCEDFVKQVLCKLVDYAISDCHTA